MSRGVLILSLILIGPIAASAGDITGTVRQPDGTAVPRRPTNFKVVAIAGGRDVATGSLTTATTPFQYKITIRDRDLDPTDVRVMLVFTADDRDWARYERIAGTAGGPRIPDQVIDPVMSPKEAPAAEITGTVRKLDGTALDKEPTNFKVVAFSGGRPIAEGGLTTHTAPFRYKISIKDADLPDPTDVRVALVFTADDRDPARFDGIAATAGGPRIPDQVIDPVMPEPTPPVPCYYYYYPVAPHHGGKGLHFFGRR